MQGVPQEAIHWWFGHNTLGVFFTPMGLAAIYYLLPKVIGRPVHSYTSPSWASGRWPCSTTGPVPIT